MKRGFAIAFSNENMSLNGGGVEVSLPPVGACCGWVHFGGEGGVVQARSWRKPIGNDPFWDCVLLLPGIKKNSLSKRWSCGREARECGQAVGNARLARCPRAVHAARRAWAGPKDSSTNPRLGARARHGLQETRRGRCDAPSCCLRGGLADGPEQGVAGAVCLYVRLQVGHGVGQPVQGLEGHAGPQVPLGVR